MPALITYRCWVCRRDVPAERLARKGAGGPGMAAGLCLECAARPPKRPGPQPAGPER